MKGKKLENISYLLLEQIGLNTLMEKVDHLQVGEGIKLEKFPNHRTMRGMTSYIEAHLKKDYHFARVINEEKRIYAVRRTR